MNPRTKKTVRVATTFTGAAACALTFAPTAHAGTGLPTAAPQPRHRVNLNTVSLDIRSASCLGSSNQVHWFHMGYSHTGSFKVLCFGGRGTTHPRPDPFLISAFCGGTNDGYIEDASGRKIQFEPGNTYRHIGRFFVSTVHISSWTGNDKCALIP